MSPVSSSRPAKPAKGGLTARRTASPTQAEPLVDVKTLQGYADWMQGLMKMMPEVTMT